MTQRSVNIAVGVFAASAVTLAISMLVLGSQVRNLKQQNSLLESRVQDYAQQVLQYTAGPTGNPEQSLGDFTMKTMEIVSSPLSKVERKVTAQQLVKIANDLFPLYEQRTNWIVLLAIESKFDNSAHSGAGAVGIGQVIPRFATEFGAHCGLEDVTEKDLRNIIVNATVSACQFRYLVDELQSIPLALAAYNAGKYSSSVESLKKLRNLNVETGSYISKWTYVKEQATKAQPEESESER